MTLINVQLHLDRLPRKSSPTVMHDVLSLGLAGSQPDEANFMRGTSDSASPQKLLQRFLRAARSCSAADDVQMRRGTDAGRPFVNVTFETTNARTLWKWLRENLGDLFGAAIVSCQGEHGWEDYLLLHHYDPAVADEIDELCA